MVVFAVVVVVVFVVLFVFVSVVFPAVVFVRFPRGFRWLAAWVAAVAWSGGRGFWVFAGGRAVRRWVSGFRGVSGVLVWLLFPGGPRRLGPVPLPGEVLPD